MRIQLDVTVTGNLREDAEREIGGGILEWLPQAGLVIKNSMQTSGLEHFKEPKGPLNASIEVDIVGATAVVAPKEPYSKYVYGGRGAVEATHAKALRFVIGGRTIFAKRVRAFPGYPIRQEAAAEAAPIVADGLRTILSRRLG